MRKTQKREAERILLVTVEGLAGMLSCGTDTAKKIGEEAQARICVGRRVFYSVQKIEDYLLKEAV